MNTYNKGIKTRVLSRGIDITARQMLNLIPSGREKKKGGSGLSDLAATPAKSRSVACSKQWAVS